MDVTDPVGTVALDPLAEVELNFSALKREGKKLIYLLCDPRDDVLFSYVGQTDDPSRFERHMWRNKSSWDWNNSADAKREWVADLRERELDFLVFGLEICAKECADDIERAWIGRFELSPFHILTNSLYDRALGAEIASQPGFAFPRHLPGMKPGRLAYIERLVEVYVNLQSRPNLPRTFQSGYRLLRQKAVTQVLEEEYAEASECSPVEYWANQFSAINNTLLAVGTSGQYTAESLPRDPERPFVVELSDYIPWILKEEGLTPEMLRQHAVNRRRSEEMAEPMAVRSSADAGPMAPFRLKWPPKRGSEQTTSQVVSRSETKRSGDESAWSEPEKKNNCCVHPTESLPGDFRASNVDMEQAPMNMDRRKFDRWLQRLGDPSSAVRAEAAERVAEIGSVSPQLTNAAIAALVQYIRSDCENYQILKALGKV